MNIDVRPATAEEKGILRNLMELYDYDFSEFQGLDVDDQGLYGDPYLDRWWTEPGRYPFLVRVEGRLAGFALVRKVEETGAPDMHAIAEFFILKKYRRQGVGRAVARQVFDLFPGRWRVSEIASNLPAQAFWRRVIAEYTHGHYQETWQDEGHWRGPEQTFTTPPSP